MPLIRNSVVTNLRGFWDFEETRLLNEGEGNLKESSNSEFADTPRGPAFIGDGLSAFFDGNHFIAIDHNSAELNSPAWTYSFWMFLIQDPTGANKPRISCPIIQKGEDTLAKSDF